MEETILQWFGYDLSMGHEQIQDNILIKNKLNKIKG